MASGWTSARAPATIANVGPGFDVFCLAISGPFDFVFSSRRRHTRLSGDWSSDVCSSDLASLVVPSGGVWLLQKCEDLPSSSDFGVICNHPESFQVQVPDHHRTQSVANGVDSRNTCCSPALPLILLLHTQCSGQDLDCPLGLMWNGKKGSPPPTDPPPPLLTAL